MFGAGVSVPHHELESFPLGMCTGEVLEALVDRAASRLGEEISLTRGLVLKEIASYWAELREMVDKLV